MVIVEAVCCSVEDCLAAERAGASRIELCSGIPLGGLTPSRAFVEMAQAAVSIPIVVLLRPREGGYCYSESEFEIMKRDMEWIRESGVEGVVIGVLLEDGRVDDERTRKLISSAGDLDVEFHRAVDVAPDLGEALESLIKMGVTRVLTSGGQGARIETTEPLRKVVEQAGDRIEIQAAGGIRANNVGKIIRETGCRMVHLGPFKQVLDPTAGFYGEHCVLDEVSLKEVVGMAERGTP